jgi:hypothetical protein
MHPDYDENRQIKLKLKETNCDNHELQIADRRLDTFKSRKYYFCLDQIHVP